MSNRFGSDASPHAPSLKAVNKTEACIFVQKQSLREDHSGTRGTSERLEGKRGARRQNASHDLSEDLANQKSSCFEEEEERKGSFAEKRSSSFFSRGGLSHISRAHRHIHNLVLGSESPRSRVEDPEGAVEVSVLSQHPLPRHGHSSSIET